MSTKLRLPPNQEYKKQNPGSKIEQNNLKELPQTFPISAEVIERLKKVSADEIIEIIAGQIDTKNRLNKESKNNEIETEKVFLLEENLNFIDPCLLILASKSDTNIFTGEKLTTKAQRVNFAKELHANGVPDKKLSKLAYVSKELLKLGFDGKIFTEYFSQKYDCSPRVAKLIITGSARLSISGFPDLNIFESMKKQKLENKKALYKNSIFENPPKQSHNINYKIDREVSFPGSFEKFKLISNDSKIPDSCTLKDSSGYFYNISRSYVEDCNPATNQEKFATLKNNILQKANNIVNETFKTMEATLVSANQLGALDVVMIRGKPRYIIKPYANINIDSKENGYEHFNAIVEDPSKRELENRYYRHMQKKLDFLLKKRTRK